MNFKNTLNPISDGYVRTSICSSKSFSEIFRNKKLESQGLMRFKAFLEEDSSAVIAQMGKIRDQMRVIRMKRQLEKEKESLAAMQRGGGLAQIELEKTSSNDTVLCGAN